uniref:Secreted protein n=1 Tax=Caenorhabditis tropicalis TaxID=1561998 RepID=A0A1I7U1Y2_9PELO
MKVYDIVTTPLIIQVSYLCCNKRNVKSLFGLLTSRSALQPLLCPCFEPTQINPVERSQIVSSTSASRYFQQ